MFLSRPYLWGRKAVEHHSIKQSLGASLSKAPSTEQVLNSLDAQLLYQSALHFPVTLRMKTLEVVRQDQLLCDAAGYDPRFLLPVFSHITAPGEK